ncbi:hypothetical protein JQ594_00900 [Bradyrhizobium manausense]|uniref:hypothetical protein n=1 Tax=Bradyrhizobium manausense TaxID=989370 RepID=UPI001BADF75E|nr:hypothetical protein [Bradyrhizobium manausense]MBR0684458.1 hypothetical protein [Bradyrhizobium manausense]
MTLLLAKYLKIHGHDGFSYICGVRGEQSRAWLGRRSLIVDITGDQFSDSSVAVFVGENSPWHAQFRIDSEHPADLDCYDQHPVFARCSLRPHSQKYGVASRAAFGAEPLSPEGRELRVLFTYLEYKNCALCRVCSLRVPIAEVGMSADELSWKTLLAFLTVITLSTVLLHAGHPPGIAIMPCFLLSMLMQGRLIE